MNRFTALVLAVVALVATLVIGLLTADKMEAVNASHEWLGFALPLLGCSFTGLFGLAMLKMAFTKNVVRY